MSETYFEIKKNILCFQGNHAVWHILNAVRMVNTVKMNYKVCWLFQLTYLNWTYNFCSTYKNILGYTCVRNDCTYNLISLIKNITQKTWNVFINELCCWETYFICIQANLKMKPKKNFQTVSNNIFSFSCNNQLT